MRASSWLERGADAERKIVNQSIMKSLISKACIRLSFVRICHLNGHRRNDADLKHEEVGGPPGQEDDLLVGEGCVHHRARHKLRVEDGDDLARDSREHSSGDVVRADCCRLDEFGVALRI